MSLNYEMARYTELSGEDGTKVPISRLGGYLDGYEKGRADAIDEFVMALEEHQQENWIDNLEYGITFADVEEVAKKLKEQESEELYNKIYNQALNDAIKFFTEHIHDEKHIHVVRNYVCDRLEKMKK